MNVVSVATVSDYMVADPITVSPETDINEATSLLLKYHISGLPVVDRHHKVVGFLSEKDCLRLVSEGDAIGHDVPQGTVEAYMTRDVVTLPPGMDVSYAAGRFLEQPYRRYPVVENGRLLGEVSRRDVMRACLGTLRAAQWEAAAQGE